MKIVKLKTLHVSVIGIVIFCTLFLPSVTMADEAEDWPQFHHDAAGTGYTASDAPDTDNVRWVSDDIGAKDSSSVAVSEGKVFVYTTDSEGSGVSCLDTANGSVLWETPIEMNAYWSWASPSYNNGSVFVSSGTKTYSLNATNGDVNWEFTNPSGLASVNGGPTIGGGYVFCSDWDGGHYYCLDEETGDFHWEFTVPGYAQSTPAYNDGYVYFCSYTYTSDNTYCVNAETGDQVWYQDGLDYDACGSPSVADGKVFITTYNFSGDGELAAMDAATGTILWEQTIQRSDSTPAYASGMLYVCGGATGYSDHSQTYCFDADTGGLIWVTPGELEAGDWTCSVAVADGKVFTGKSPFCEVPGTLALDITDGSVIWSADLGGSSPVVADGVVYTSGGGCVYAFGAPDYPDWDVNEDGTTDYLDMIMVGNHYGETGDEGWIREDVNDDGEVDYLDMIIIGNHYGE